VAAAPARMDVVMGKDIAPAAWYPANAPATVTNGRQSNEVLRFESLTGNCHSLLTLMAAAQAESILVTWFSGPVVSEIQLKKYVVDFISQQQKLITTFLFKFQNIVQRDVAVGNRNGAV
jgi:hypothetical protein